MGYCVYVSVCVSGCALLEGGRQCIRMHRRCCQVLAVTASFYIISVGVGVGVGLGVGVGVGVGVCF